VERACDLCGSSYEAQRSTSRFCSPSCRVRAHQRGLDVPSSSADVVATLSPEPQPAVDLVEAATVAALEEVERLETPLGRLAVSLAHRVDNSQRETGQAVAALARQLAATLEQATAGAKSTADGADELRERRVRRRAG
jgi:hypothetical protein